MSSTHRPRETILVVEDDLECLESLRDALEHGGYVVRTAMNGLDALTLLDAHPAPHLILLDLMMPGMDGWQFLRELRARAALQRVPVALLSGEGELARRASELAVAGYVQKPATLDGLLSAVGGLLARSAHGLARRGSGSGAPGLPARPLASACSTSARSMGRRGPRRLLLPRIDDLDAAALHHAVGRVDGRTP